VHAPLRPPRGTAKKLISAKNGAEGAVIPPHSGPLSGADGGVCFRFSSSSADWLRRDSLAQTHSKERIALLEGKGQRERDLRAVEV
jgi:hypothetical protein